MAATQLSKAGARKTQDEEAHTVRLALVEQAEKLIEDMRVADANQHALQQQLEDELRKRALRQQQHQHAKPDAAAKHAAISKVRAAGDGKPHGFSLQDELKVNEIKIRRQATLKVSLMLRLYYS